MTDCSCIKGESGFMFSLESLSKDLLIFQDLSDWMDHVNYKEPSTYILNVTPPGAQEGVAISIDVQKKNKLTSKELFGVEGKSIPDGIYCIKVTNCQYTYTRYVAVLYRLQCCVDQLFSEGKDTKELDILIKQIAEAANFQDSTTANKLYRIAINDVKAKNCSC